MKSKPLGTVGRSALAGAYVAALVSGCQPPASPRFANWIPETGSTASPAEAASFRAALRIAAEAEERTRPYAGRVHFTPGQREAIVARLSPQLSELRRIARSPFAFLFQPVRPGEQPAHRRGWVLLGKALTWSIEAQAHAGELDAAIEGLLSAVGFGLRLTGGDAMDADLGLSMLDDARRAFAPLLRELSPAQLERLSQGIATALDERPPLAAAIRNERLNMLAGVQWIQDAYRDNALDRVRAVLGPDVADALTYLERMRQKDAEKRPAYFQGFASEADRWADHFTKLSTLNARQRRAVGAPQLAEHRPWRRFARHLFASCEPLFAKRDETLARTRLFALEAGVRARILSTGAAPKDLYDFSEGLLIDPFSGEPFVYRAEGKEYRLYSVGANGHDDGGETDEASSAPDLLLEGRMP